MIRRRHISRRGTAMLVVLAVTMLTVSALLVVARATAAATAARHTGRSAAIADDLLAATDRPIRAWLAAEASDAVLPPDALVPMLPVCGETWTCDRFRVELAITAFDQCGMVPADAVRGAMRGAITDPAIQAIAEQVAVPRGRQTGLDLYAPAARRVEVRVFPTSNDDEPAGAEAAGAVGGLLATHNPAPGRVNVNTAPMAVVEAALKLAGRGGLELIAQARAAGERHDPPAPPQQPRRRGARPTITGTSNAWAFRIDVTVNDLRRSWWRVYCKPDDGKPWECEQTLAILD